MVFYIIVGIIAMIAGVVNIFFNFVEKKLAGPSGPTSQYGATGTPSAIFPDTEAQLSDPNFDPLQYADYSGNVAKPFDPMTSATSQAEHHEEPTVYL